MLVRKLQKPWGFADDMLAKGKQDLLGVPQSTVETFRGNRIREGNEYMPFTTLHWQFHQQ
jgi:hypothetical protein